MQRDRSDNCRLEKVQNHIWVQYVCTVYEHSSYSYTKMRSIPANHTSMSSIEGVLVYNLSVIILKQLLVLQFYKDCILY